MVTLFKKKTVWPTTIFKLKKQNTHKLETKSSLRQTKNKLREFDLYCNDLRKICLNDTTLSMCSNVELLS
jgi:hypothetical protein